MFPWNETIQITALGLLGWFVWYTLAKSQPKLIDTFKEELEKQRTVHVEQDKRREAAFITTLDGQRKDFREDMALTRTVVETLSQNLHHIIHKEPLPK